MNRLGYYGGRLGSLSDLMPEPEPVVTVPEGLAFVGGIGIAVLGWYLKSTFIEGVGATVAGGSVLIAIQRKAEEAARYG